MELLFLLKIITFYIYVRDCFAVDFSYINMENENEVQQKIEKVDSVDSRRSINSTILSTVLNIHTTAQPTTQNENDYDYEDTFDMKIYIPHADKKPKKTTHVSKKTPISTTSSAPTKTKSKRRKPITPVNLFTIFQYDIDAVEDESEDEYDKPQQPLRQRPENITKLKSDYTFNSTADQNNTNKRFNQFYNLEPAAVLFDFRNPKERAHSYHTWYVPEKYPCWDLPLLYGEFGRKKIADQVFVISPVKLKYVLDENEEKPPSHKTPTADRKLDKWCGVSPCYGDHTLCVYSSQSQSHLCDVKYSVVVPNMVEQIALVNTLNSMRNHVAKGSEKQFPHLPPAANMQQVIYDYDLEAMAAAWLRQCLPGPAPCNALDASFVSELECTKFSEKCCRKGSSPRSCTPKQECFIDPIIGCLHTWFWSAGNKISVTDVKCGHVESRSYSTAQLIWAKTNKIGCAYGIRESGDIRVVCNFAPGAPFVIKTKFYCGILAHKDITNMTEPKVDTADILSKKYLFDIGIDLMNITVPKYVHSYLIPKPTHPSEVTQHSWGISSLRKIYGGANWARRKTGDYNNGTRGLIARLVTRYQFSEETKARCDLEEPMYAVGPPGALCVETGRKFYALCYDFRDPDPGYRVVAVLAPVALFSLILYDLFSGVMRQTNY